MIEYDTEDWLWRTSCRWKGSVVPHALIIALPSSLLGALLVHLREEFPAFRESSEVPNFPTTAWAVLAMPMTILIAFRTKQAFGRFWEGTGLLHAMRGEWFDSASCLATFSLPTKSKKPKEVAEFRHTLLRLMSLCHGSALDEIKDKETEQYEVLDLWGLGDETLNILRECKKQDFNRVEVILHMIQVLVINAQQKGIIEIPPPILSRVYQTLSRGFVNLLSAKKIRATRFPFPWAQLLSIFLLLFALVTPYVLASLIESRVWCAIFTFMPVFSLLCLNYTAGELEMPFGHDDNDLPLDNFQQEMNTSLLMLMHEGSDHVAEVRSGCIMDFEVVKEHLKSEAMYVTSSRASRRGPSVAAARIPSMFKQEDAERRGSLSYYTPGAGADTDSSPRTSSMSHLQKLQQSPEPKDLAGSVQAVPVALPQPIAQALKQQQLQPPPQQQPQLEFELEQPPQQQMHHPLPEKQEPEQPPDLQQALRESIGRQEERRSGQQQQQRQQQAEDFQQLQHLQVQGFQPPLPFTRVLMLQTGPPTELQATEAEARASQRPLGGRQNRTSNDRDPMVQECSTTPSRPLQALPALDRGGASAEAALRWTPPAGRSSWTRNGDQNGRRSRPDGSQSSRGAPFEDGRSLGGERNTQDWAAWQPPHRCGVVAQDAALYS